MKEAKEMTTEELKQEVERIRGERSGVGRVRRAESKTRRISGQMSEKRRVEEAQKEESAEWV